MKLSRQRLIEIRASFKKLMETPTGNAAAAYFIAENYRLIIAVVGEYGTVGQFGYQVPREYANFQEDERAVYRKYKCSDSWRYLNSDIVNHCTDYGTIPILKSDEKKLDRDLNYVRERHKVTIDAANNARREAWEKKQKYDNEEFEIEFVKIRLRDLPGMMPEDMRRLLDLNLIKGTR